MPKMKKIILIVAAYLTSVAHADSAVLTNFLANAKTIKANFSQTIVTGKKSRTTLGTMEISRPNKFRWEYTQDQQLIVSDAKQIYLYDKPLQQVTIRQLGKSIDKSPAAVLAGANDLQSAYKVSDVATKAAGLNWVRIDPKIKNDNNGFQVVLMGFDKQGKLSQMQFTDSFGNKTSISFSNLQTGVAIPASDYTFTPPAGVDVLQE